MSRYRNSRSEAPVCPDFTSVMRTWQKRKWKKGRLLDFQAFPEKPKFLVFVEQKVDNKFLKRFYTGSMSKGGPRSQRRSLPFCRNPLKKKKKLGFLLLPFLEAFNIFGYSEAIAAIERVIC
jgi:hypothetical protein